MKTIGKRKATEFSQKQINVLYMKAKNGELKIERWFINKLYTLSEYCGKDTDNSVANRESDVLKILDAVFAKDLEKAQDLINQTTINWYETFDEKTKRELSRSFIKEEKREDCATEKQKEQVNSEEVTQNIHATLDAAIKYIQKTYPNASEFNRTIDRVADSAAYYKKGSVSLTNVGDIPFYDITYEIGVIYKKTHHKLYYSYTHKKEFIKTDFSNAQISEILALIKAE